MTRTRLKNDVRHTKAGPRQLAWSACALGALGMLASCGGGGGSDGKKGTPGVPGDPAPTDSSLTKFEEAPGVELEIIGVSGGSLPDLNPGSSAAPLNTSHFAPGDTLTVTFTVKQDDGTAWGLNEMTTARILMSGPTFNYQRVLAERTDVVAASVKVGEATYSYTFPTPIPETYLPPVNDTEFFGLEDGELSGEDLLGGTYTVGMYMAWNYTVDGDSFRDVGNATFDFLLGEASDIEPREVVLIENCNQCHVSLQAHGGLRRDPTLCLLCHTAGSEDRNTPSVEGGTPGVSMDFKVLMHKLHNGAHLPSVNGVATNEDGTRNYDATPVPYKVIGFNNNVHDYSHVKYPVWPNLTSNVPKDLGYSALTSGQKAKEDAIRGGATTCLKCHGDPDGDGPVPAPAQGDLYKTQPGRASCASCHDDIDWDKPYVANGQEMTVAHYEMACNTCHAAEGDPLAVVDGHIHPLENPAIDPGVVVEVSGISGGSGAGGRFEAGDRPALTFSLTDNDGADVDITGLDASVSMLVGPTFSQQIVMPYTGTNNVSLSPYDFAGRLVATSTTNKGSMSKVIASGAAVAETLTVQFNSSTGFDVTGAESGALGSSALAASPSTNPAGSSLSALTLTAAALPQTVTVTFSGPQAFTVTGSVSGGMGSGVLPSTVSGSNRFVSDDGTLSFNLAVGATPFAAGNSIHLVIVETSAPNEVLFGIVAGRTSFAATAPTRDRFYYQFEPPASTYTLSLPMELVLEYLGEGSGSAGQVLTAGNTPVIDGYQALSEVTAVANPTTLTADVEPFARYVDVASTAGYTTASTTYVVLDSAGGVGTREYLQLGWVESATRMWFKSPVRYAHASGAAVGRATLALRLEGATSQYELDSDAGTVTSVVAFGTGNGVVMTYRTDGRFGYHRHFGDTLQDVYQPPPNDSDTLGPEWGEWVGKPYTDGTYTAALWFSRNLQVSLYNELQTYRSTSLAANHDFLYGAGAVAIEPHGLITSVENCSACHNDVQFHGGGRSGYDSCIMCHSIGGAEDKPKYDNTAALPTTGVTIDFRTMLHKIHMGADLTNPSAYQIVGFQASVSVYDEVHFPAFPGGTMNCTKCHGDDSDSWLEPADRDYPDGQTPTVQEWAAVCGSCHDSELANIHFEAQTSPSGAESCALCHGEGSEDSVELAHKVR